LKHRGDAQFLPEWESFFSSIPTRDEEHHESFVDVMLELSKSYGNSIYIPSIYVRGKLKSKLNFICVVIKYIADRLTK
jgi:hypothetical protein